MNGWMLVRAFVMVLKGRRSDAAALAAASLGTGAYYHAAMRLREMEQPFPAIDLDALRQCPVGSFGHAYVAFMDTQRRRPYRISKPIATELGRCHRLAVRALVLNDALHVLLGFDGTFPGRLGVLAFNAAHRDGSACDQAARLFRGLSSLSLPVLPSRHKERCELRGRRLAAHSKSLLLEPLETRWNEPLDRVRSDLGLPLTHPTGCMNSSEHPETSSRRAGQERVSTEMGKSHDGG